MQRPWSRYEVRGRGRIRYPNPFVFCSAAERDQTVIPDPVVVFEVLSPSTSRTDRVEKWREYQAKTSIRRYIILEQGAIAATVYFKQDELWAVNVLTETDTPAMPEIEASIELAAIYAEVELPPPDAAAEA